MATAALGAEPTGPELIALENVEYVMLLQGLPDAERRTRARSILAEVGLAGLEDRRPGELSGGQQQRVAVARAIVTAPALVLADEPTANLDSATGAGLMDLMRRLNETKGVTFISPRTIPWLWSARAGSCVCATGALSRRPWRGACSSSSRRATCAGIGGAR